MLSAKSWKSPAIVRLLVSMFICIYSGSLVLTAIQMSHGGPKRNLILALLLASLLLLIAGLVQVQRPWNLDTLFQQMLIAMACVYGGMIIGLWAQHLAGPPASVSAVLRMIVATLSFHGTALFLIHRFLRDHDIGWSQAFGFHNRLLHAILFGITAVCIFLPIAWTLQKVSLEILQHIPKHPIKAQEQEAVQALRIASSLFHRVALGTVTILLAPAAEEMLFRGILYPWIKRRGFPLLAILITSILFAFMHLNIVTFIPLFVLSLVQIFLYEKTDNLMAPMTTHALFNAVNFFMLYLTEKQLT